MNVRDHTTIEELIVAKSIGGLGHDDELALERARAEHGPGCEECRLLEAEYASVAGRLAFALEPAPLRDGFEDEVVDAALTERVRLVRSNGVAPPARIPRHPGIRLRPLVAVAAAAVLLVGGWVMGAATSAGDPGVPAGARVVAFQGEAGSLAIAYEPGEPGVYLLGSDLPEPAPGEVLEIWMIRDGEPVPGACVVPAQDGSLFAFVDAELGTTEAMAVTVEPSSCPSSPTSDPILTAEIV